jgi:hypothetical protein
MSTEILSQERTKSHTLILQNGVQQTTMAIVTKVAPAVGPKPDPISDLVSYA